MRLVVALLVLVGLAASAEPARCENDVQVAPASLTGQAGDPARGRSIVANRQVGLCLLCHAAPIPEERFQGNLAPDLTGVGSRYNEEQLRQRIIDASRLNPDTIMPAYYRTDHVRRPAPAFANKTILSAEQIEDVVAYLTTLRQEVGP